MDEMIIILEIWVEYYITKKREFINSWFIEIGEITIGVKLLCMLVISFVLLYRLLSFFESFRLWRDLKRAELDEEAILWSFG